MRNEYIFYEELPVIIVICSVFYTLLSPYCQFGPPYLGKGYSAAAPQEQRYPVMHHAGYQLS